LNERILIAQVPALKLATAPIDPTPVFYYWLHALLVPSGAGVVAARSISLAAGVLAIPAAYALGRSMAGRAVALFAAAWCAVAGPLVDYSQEDRAYSVLALLTLLSALALQRAIQVTGTRRRWALAGFITATLLALYTHFIAFFWAAPACLVLRIDADRSKDPTRVRAAWMTALALAIGAAPEVLRTFRYATEATGFHWLRQPGALDFGRLVLSQWLPVGGTILGLGVAAALLLLAARRRASIADWARRRPSSALILGALLLQPLALWGFGFFAQPVAGPFPLAPGVHAASKFALCYAVTPFPAVLELTFS
jgi:4-amino-4-deoxy-L-arabinose transferase-like glycosyltransferase